MPDRRMRSCCSAGKGVAFQRRDVTGGTRREHRGPGVDGAALGQAGRAAATRFTGVRVVPTGTCLDAGRC